MIQPTIETERLFLRPFAANDAKKVQRLAGNFKVSEYTLSIPFPYKDGFAEEWISKHEDLWELRKEAIFAIAAKFSNKLVGSVGLVSINGNEAELGYWIGEQYWNKGYATESAKAIIEFSINKLSVSKLKARHLTANPASGNVLLKIGMSHVNQITMPDRNSKMKSVEYYEFIVSN